MKIKDCYVCVFSLSVLKIFILELYLPFSFAHPVGQQYDQFMKYIIHHQCNLPSQIKFFSSPDSNWDFLSLPLQPCNRDDNFEISTLCAEIFENLVNTTCHKNNVSVPTETFKLSSDVCGDFEMFKVPKIDGFFGAKLADDMVCKAVCEKEVEELCKILLWSYRVRYYIEKFLKHPQVLDEKSSDKVPKEKKTETVQIETSTTLKTGNAKVDAKKTKLPGPEKEQNETKKEQESTLKKPDAKNEPLLIDAHPKEKQSSTLQTKSATVKDTIAPKKNNLDTIVPEKNSLDTKQENQTGSSEPHKTGKSNKHEDEKVLNDAKIDENKSKFFHEKSDILPNIAINLDSEKSTPQSVEVKNVTKEEDKKLLSKAKQLDVPHKISDVKDQSKQIDVDEDTSKNTNNVIGDNQDILKDTEKSTSNPTTGLTNVTSSSVKSSIQSTKSGGSSPLIEEKSSASGTNIATQNSSLDLKSSTLEPTLEKMDDENEIPPPVQEEDQYSKFSENDMESVGDMEGEYDRPDYAQDTGLSSPTEQQKDVSPDLFITSEKTDDGTLGKIRNDMSLYDDLLPKSFDGQISRDVHEIPTFPEEEDGHFFFYFLSIIFILMAGYLIFHNKQKIIALIVEGRHERRRRSYSAGYKKLETK